MALNTNVNDPTFDLTDAIAYEYFMENLSVMMGDSLGNPDITDAEIEELVNGISILAAVSYKVAERFEHIRNAVKKSKEVD